MADLEKIAKDMIVACSKRDFAGACEHFDKNLAAALTEFMWSETWGRIVRQVGMFKAVKATRPFHHVLSPVKVVFVDCEFERAPVSFEVTFPPGEQIGGLTFMTPGLGG